MSSGGDLNRRAWHWNKLCPVFFFVRPLIEDKIIRKIFEVSRGRIGEPGHTDEDQRFTHLGGQLGKRRAEFCVFRASDLIRLYYQRFRVPAIDILDLSAPLAALRVEFIAENRRKPSAHVRAR